MGLHERKVDAYARHCFGGLRSDAILIRPTADDTLTPTEQFSDNA
jgi:hypothetical protein